MKSKQEHLTRIAAYLSGQLTDTERQSFELWAKASAENERLFKEASTIWKNSGIKFSIDAPATSQAEWLELRERLDSIQKSGKLVSFFTAPLTLKIAASIILLMGVAYLFVWFSASPDRPMVFHADKEMISFYLPDSSQVWLNAKSTLKFDEHFNEAERHVQLQGEGYFKVSANHKNPFIVTTAGTYTRVVGTSFSIREDSATETVLTVVEGTVSFASQKDLTKTITVGAKEKAMCTSAGEVKKYSNDNTKFSHWIKKDNPVFENEKLYPVAHLKTDFTWRKNAIKQSVIDGTVKSSATIATYQNVKLKITYTRRNGKLKTIDIDVPGPIPAGGQVNFRAKLHDLLTNTRQVLVKVESAEAKSTL